MPEIPNTSRTWDAQEMMEMKAENDKYFPCIIELPTKEAIEWTISRNGKVDLDEAIKYDKMKRAIRPAA